MEILKRPLSGCDLQKCRHGSFISSSHPCYKGCKYNFKNESKFKSNNTGH